MTRSREQAMNLNDFEGNWALERQVSNAIGPDAVFAGHARFVPDEEGLILTEEGRMTIEGQVPMQGVRRYLWRQEGADIVVLFDDGRYFHRFPPDGTPEAGHDCAPDVYKVAYDFTAWPVWTARWQVVGPRKDYLMKSRYARA